MLRVSYFSTVLTALPPLPLEQNEEEVGAAIRASGITREQVSQVCWRFVSRQAALGTPCCSSPARMCLSHPRELCALLPPLVQLFITSKVSPYQQGTEAATAACEASLRLLGTYIDLMLVSRVSLLWMFLDAGVHQQPDEQPSMRLQGLWQSLHSTVHIALVLTSACRACCRSAQPRHPCRQPCTGSGALAWSGQG